ncbi:hypothetical protein BTM255_12630 [Helicobacter pylori]
MEVYSQQTTHEEMIKNCKVYVMWGADLFKCNRIDYFVPNHVNDGYYPKYINIKELVSNSLVSIPFIPKPLKPLVLNGYPFALILM